MSLRGYEKPVINYFFALGQRKSPGSAAVGGAAIRISPHTKEALYENCNHLHRWRLLRQSRPRGLGSHFGLERHREGDLRRSPGDHQQPHGAHRRHRSLVPAEGAVRGGALQRQQVCHRRPGKGVGLRLEEKGLDQERQKARPECGSLGAAPAPRCPA